MTPQELLGVPGLTFGGAGVWTLVAIVVVWIIRTKPKMLELQNAADNSLRHDLMERIDSLEKQISLERQDFEKRMSEERRECDRALDSMRTEFRAAIKANEQTIEGLHRQLLAQSSALTLRLPASTAASGAADRVVERLTRDLDTEGKKE